MDRDSMDQESEGIVLEVWDGGVIYDALLWRGIALSHWISGG